MKYVLVAKLAMINTALKRRTCLKAVSMFLRCSIIYLLRLVMEQMWVGREAKSVRFGDVLNN